MTASPPPEHPTESMTGLDSSAQLMTRLSVQLSSQLSRLRPPAAQGVRAEHVRRATDASADGSAHSGRPAPTLLAVAHGSRDPEARRTVTALLSLVRSLRPGLRVRLGHIELNEPLLTDALGALSGEVVVVPLLFGRGYHIKHDIPDAVAGAPQLDTRVAHPLGPHPLLADALHARLVEAGWRGVGDVRRSGVVLAAAGSRDPDSARDAERMADQLSARLGGVQVVPAYASAAGPGIPEAVHILRSRGRTRIGLASYFTAPGRFAARCAAAGPVPAAAPIGAHRALARLVLLRYDEARAATADRTTRTTRTAVGAAGTGGTAAAAGASAAAGAAGTLPLASAG